MTANRPGTWERRDGLGQLSARQQKAYEDAGVTWEQYAAGYSLSNPDKPTQQDVTEWTRDQLETTVKLQWQVIRHMEGKIHGKVNGSRHPSGRGRSRAL